MANNGGRRTLNGFLKHGFCPEKPTPGDRSAGSFQVRLGRERREANAFARAYAIV